jgi:glycosyltransferase involved in cell wall biosynthesis
LGEALDSLACQTLRDIEVIAVDDGSVDATAAILQARAELDRRFHVITQPHTGLVEALNRGLRACQSPYIARMDSDDLCHPERLERQLAYLASHSEISVLGCKVAGFPPASVRQGYKLYIDWLNSLTTDVDIRREMFVESPLAHPSVVYRKDWVLRVGGYQDRGWPEDYDLWLRLYLAGARFAKVPEILLEWREHPARLTRTDGRYSVENFLRAKAYYLMQGPLSGREAVFIWGAGMMGRRLGKQLQRLDAPLTAFVDIDPRKIGSTRRGLPILSPPDLLRRWPNCSRPVLLVAVGTRGARPLIRQRLLESGLTEGEDWWFAA